MNIIKEIINNPILMLFLGVVIANFGWAINWELPYSQGVMLLKADVNVFWFMTYISLLPIIGILLYKFYKEVRKKMKRTVNNSYQNFKMIEKLEKWWDDGMGMGLGRKFSLLISVVWIYTGLIVGIFIRSIHYYTIVLGLFLLVLDNHNFKEESASRG